jgi:hypothetical protein
LPELPSLPRVGTPLLGKSRGAARGRQQRANTTRNMQRTRKCERAAKITYKRA